MNKARLNIATSKLVGNTGQLPWLPKNPRQWTLGDVNRTVKSITEDADFLEDRPLLAVPAESGKGERYIVFAGNLRLKACKEALVKTVPVVVYFPQDEDDQLTIKRRAMKDNGSFGSWDFDALANEWDDLPLADFGIPAWEAEEGAGGAAPAETTTAEEDDFDETQDVVETRCKLGDIWQLGNHRLMCGDSTNPDDFALLMDGNVADIAVTSPPYNVHHLGVAASKERGGGTQKCTQKKYLADDDKRTDEEFQTFLESNVSLLLKHSNEIFYNIGVGAGSKRTIVRLLNTFINEFKDLLYWEKSNPQPLIAKGVISSSVELVIAFGKNNSRSFANFDNVLFHGVINGPSAAATNKYADIHKATFPVYFPAELIKNFTKENASVLDCFGGTGTTMIAAEQLNRRCYMMELDAQYCDVILARWEKLTGKTAIKIAG